jgi:hypothetical protein
VSNRNVKIVKKHNFSTPPPDKIKVDSWWRWAFWHCSYCLCKCDDGESPDSDRYWSLKSAIADTDDNMVVTGVREEEV